MALHNTLYRIDVPFANQTILTAAYIGILHKPWKDKTCTWEPKRPFMKICSANNHSSKKRSPYLKQAVWGVTVCEWPFGFPGL